MGYEFLSHTADVKFRAFGRSLEECFSSAAYALRDIMCKEDVANKLEKKIFVEGIDLENLLYNFLEEFLYLFEVENFILGKISSIKIDKRNDGFELKASITGDYVYQYELEESVKAITYNEMFVKQFDGKWICQVVVDM